MGQVRPARLKQLPQEPSQSCAHPCAPTQQVAFDAMDMSVLAAIPADFLEGVTPLKASAKAVYEQGVQGDEMRCVLIREAQLARVQLRYREIVAAVLLERFLIGRADRCDLDVVEKSVARATQRFHGALDRLSRLEAPPMPQNVTAISNRIRVEIHK